MRYSIVDRQSRSIVLIGMMGAGKSSVGQCLHYRTGLALLDIDEVVASAFGMSIPEIFAEYGEKKFREAETEALRRMRTEERTIIITGGGIVVRNENTEILKRLGLIVWLDGDEETLFLEFLGARRPIYANTAVIRVDTSLSKDKEAAVAILQNLGE